MSFRQPSRMHVGLVLIAAFVALADLHVLRAAWTTYRAVERPDEVSRHEARFQALKRALGARRAVGYLGDESAQAADPASPAAREAFKRYLLTQYALVPILLARGPEGDVVVGDFTATAPPTVATLPGFVVVEDFGDGVVLFRRLPR